MGQEHRSSNGANGADRTYRIWGGAAGQTLLAGLRRLRAELSRPEARRLIEGRRVQLNGNLAADPEKRLKAGDVVKVLAHARAAAPTAGDVRVRHVDRDLVVVEKPPGVTTMREPGERGGHRTQRQATLDELLTEALACGFQVKPQGAGARRPRTPRRGEKAPTEKAAARGGKAPASIPPTRIRPVHRLDRETSGLMLFALSPAAERALSTMFKTHAVRRAYLAVAHGQVLEQTFRSYMLRDRGDGLRGSDPAGADNPAAREAITHVKPIERFGDGYTLLECRLETGRTHQIRIHLAEAGHMLCGEKTYTRPTPGAAPVGDVSGAPRHALHSAELSFVHPITGRTMHFTSPLPADLSRWVHRLRRRFTPRADGG